MNVIAAIALTLLSFSPQFQVGQRGIYFSSPAPTPVWHLNLCGDISSTSGCVPTSSTTVYDSSGGGFGNGTWYGNQSGTNYYYSAGYPLAYAGAFDGSTNNVYLSTQVLPAAMSVWSWTMWVNLSSTSLKGIFFSIGGGGSGYAVGVGSGDADTTGNELIVETNGRYWNRTNTNIGTGWHCIAVTRDGTNLRAYIDTTQVGVNLSTATPNSLTDGESIGADTGGTTSPYQPFSGLIGSVAVYNVTLSPSQTNCI